MICQCKNGTKAAGLDAELDCIVEKNYVLQGRFSTEAKVMSSSELKDERISFLTRSR